MSQPTTPARSIALSAFSTPSTAQNGTSPQELTPRSKVKAMLAAIDDESDNESPPPQRIGGSKREFLSTVTGNVQNAQRRKDLDFESIDAENEADSEEDPIVPRGRLAAGLQGQASKCSNPGPLYGNEDKENAYARIKEQLLQKRPRRASQIVSEFEPNLTSSKDYASTSRPSETRLSPRSRRSSDPSPNNTTIVSRRPSPTLFLSPRAASEHRETPQSTASNVSSDSDLPANPQTNSRFLELVARKRAEREAKQAEEDRKRAERFAKQRSFQQQLSRDASSASGLSDEDEMVERKLTQQARPTRKASKKALEEMNRETQRMSRNMQLAHQAKTKKKITKESLLARFNFRTPASSNIENPQQQSSSTVASSRPATDVEDVVNEESPPTSPLTPDDPSVGAVDLGTLKDSIMIDSGTADAEQAHTEREEDDLPSMVDILSTSMPKTEKAKGKAKEQHNSKASLQTNGSRSTFTQPPIRIRPPKPSMAGRDLSSDSDLEILPTRKIKKARIDVFDRLPAAKVQNARSLQTLRALAHLNSPEKQARGKKATMSLVEMQSSLQRRARQQATEERAERIAELKSRGIIVQTAEERQKDQVEVEDLLEKARREGEELKQQEKRAAKKEKIANGEVDGLPDTSDEDEDYREDEEPDVELSGSEDEQQIIDDGEESASDVEESQNEEEGEEGGESPAGNGSQQHGLIDNEASEDGDDEQEAEEDDDELIDDDIDGNNEPPSSPLYRSRRNRLVIEDDEDEDDTPGSQTPTQGLQAPVDVPMFPPGLESIKLDCEPMGMTQAFAATMADTQTQAEATEEEQDSMALLGPPPEPDFPMSDAPDSPQVIEDSQNRPDLTSGNSAQNTGLQEIQLDFSQSQIQYGALGDTQDPVMTTQVSEMPDPTQDVGFTLSSPAPERFVNVPQSTADTVLLTPAKKPRRRLQRRLVASQTASDVEDVSSPRPHPDAGIEMPANAFDMMKKARKDTSAAEMFDKKKSEAKTMVEEQAQESEDEYAGLGGASDDESGGEEDDYSKEIIDQGEVNVNERQLAALYANNERASDEKAVEKLFKDINSGMLRRKRGAEFDLSDSEDDAEARQRRKRREFAKMRKALLENENVGKIAEDPKKLAFLRAIEDREDDDEELDFLDRPAEDSFRVENDTQEVPDSQSQQQQTTLPEGGTSLGKRKRPLSDSIPNNKTTTRPPPSARRTAAPPKKPATLAEIRESVSFLIEDPGSINTAPAHPSSSPSASENEDEDQQQHQQHSNPRRRRPNQNTNPIIDRLSLKRTESASLSSSSRLAFHDPSSTSLAPGFKIPSLLRRATTSQLLSSTDANGISTNNNTSLTERAAGGGEKGDFVRRGGTKRCSVNWRGRGREKGAGVEAVERRRWEGRKREAARRREGGGLGGLAAGTGGFE